MRDPIMRQSPELGDAQTVFLRALLDRLFTSSQRLGECLECHPLAGELVQFLNLILPPRLPVTLELFAHSHSPCLECVYHDRRALSCGPSARARTAAWARRGLS